MEENMEKLLFNFNNKTDIDVIVLNGDEIVDYYGDTDRCIKYLIKEKLDEEYKSQYTWNSKKDETKIIFLKEKHPFTNEEISLIKGCIYLIEKYW